VRVGEGDGVLAGVGQDVELVGGVAADAAGVRLHGAEVQAAALEDAAVGLEHDLIGRPQRVVVQVEGVGVLHQEFAGPHDTEARADLVAELGLDLVEVHRELLVGAQLIAGQVGDDLLVGGPEAELAGMAVAHPQQLGAVVLPASGLLPQLRRLYRRHQDLQRPGAIHLLAHDALDLAQHPKAERQPGVEPGGKLADHARAQHQAVAGNLGVGRGLLDGIQRKLGGTHGVGL